MFAHSVSSFSLRKLLRQFQIAFAERKSTLLVGFYLVGFYLGAVLLVGWVFQFDKHRTAGVQNHRSRWTQPTRRSLLPLSERPRPNSFP